MRFRRLIHGRNPARPFPMMDRHVPGRCAGCGSDAYIQLAVGDAMLCAHCYQERLGLTKKPVGRKGGERTPPQPAVIAKAPAPRPRAG
ncbi:MAG TPA: hypothetical protein VK732_02585 [Verrucomicrobiae bacterium]|nr:hypothetical protein [Verrucomicrobiae bacterium]